MDNTYSAPNNDGIIDVREDRPIYEKVASTTTTRSVPSTLEGARHADGLEMDDKEQKRLLRRIDIAIVPCQYSLHALTLIM